MKSLKEILKAPPANAAYYQIFPVLTGPGRPKALRHDGQGPKADRWDPGEEPGEDLPDGKYRVVWYDAKDTELARSVGEKVPTEREDAPPGHEPPVLSRLLGLVEAVLGENRKLTLGYTGLVDGYKTEITELQGRIKELEASADDGQGMQLLQALVGGAMQNPDAVRDVVGAISAAFSRRIPTD